MRTVSFLKLSLSALAICCGLLPAAAQTMEDPVTLSMTISFTGPETSKVSSAGTDYKATLSTFKFTNRDYLAALSDEQVIPSVDGWKLVARWTAGAMPDSYGFWLVHPTLAAVPLDVDTSPSIDLTATASGYSERWNNGVAISGSGKIKVYTGFSFNADGDQFQLSGVGTGSYAIKPPYKGAAPSIILNSIKLTLLGGIVAEDAEGVLEMTLTVGAPKFLKGTEPKGGGIRAPIITIPPSGGPDITISPSS